jgi:hypothetical protein
MPKLEPNGSLRTISNSREHTQRPSDELAHFGGGPPTPNESWAKRTSLYARKIDSELAERTGLEMVLELQNLRPFSHYKASFPS